MASNIITRELSLARALHRAKYDPQKHFQNSKLGTYHFQNALPKLPVPSLDDTTRRLTNSAEAMAGHPSFQQEHLDDFREKWADFVAGDGARLDKLLKDEDNKNKHTNFVNEPWTVQYLRDRRPLMVNYNPTVVLTDAGQEANRPNYLQRGTQIIYTAAKYHLTLIDELMHPDVFHLKQKPSKNRTLLTKWLPNTRVSLKSKGIDNQAMRYLPYAMNNSFPLDMGQFGNVLFSTRIPRKNMDTIEKGPSTTKHVVVFYRGRAYKVDAFDDKFMPRAPNDILADLEAIKTDGDERGFNQSAICALSSSERNRWAANREHLVELGNAASLDAIDHAMFALVLDDYAYNEPGDCCKQHIAGPAQNRWPDKSFSVVMGHCGKAGVVFEHAWGDGAAVLHFMNSTNTQVEQLTSDKSYHYDISTTGLVASSSGIANEIEFVVDDHINSEIKEAIAIHDDVRDTMDMVVCVMGDAPAVRNPYYYDQDGDEAKEIRARQLNRNWMQKHKLGPDGFLQLSLQIAASRLKGYPLCVYESASTSMFKDGRTETIRPCTKEVVAVAKLFETFNVENEDECIEMTKAIRTAIRAHNNQTKDCLGGGGFDRHLFGLKTQAAKNNIDLHPVFDTEVMKNISNFLISTSTLNSNAVSLGAFGPVGTVNPETNKPDGYGVGYCVFGNWMGVSISGYAQNGYSVYEYQDSIYHVWEQLVQAVETATAVSAK